VLELNSTGTVGGPPGAGLVAPVLWCVHLLLCSGLGDREWKKQYKKTFYPTFFEFVDIQKHFLTVKNNI